MNIGTILPAVLAIAVATPSMAASMPDVSVTNPWMRLIAPSAPAGGYMTIHNQSNAPITLTGEQSPGCGMMMLHQTQGERMLAVPAATIPPHGTLALSPGGYHLMCMSPNMKVGGALPVTLSFQGGGTYTVPFTVIGARDRPPEGK